MEKKMACEFFDRWWFIFIHFHKGI
jgi:hypothetical protein